MWGLEAFHLNRTNLILSVFSHRKGKFNNRNNKHTSVIRAMLSWFWLVKDLGFIHYFPFSKLWLKFLKSSSWILTKMRKFKKWEFFFKCICYVTFQSASPAKPVLAVLPTVCNQFSSVRLSVVNIVLPILNSSDHKGMFK